MPRKLKNTKKEGDEDDTDRADGRGKEYPMMKYPTRTGWRGIPKPQQSHEREMLHFVSLSVNSVQHDNVEGASPKAAGGGLFVVNY